MGTIVMLPGACSTAWIFNEFRDHFEAAGWTVLTPGLRYHDQGPDQPPDPRLTQTGLADYLADLCSMIEDLDRPPVLLGHSMGGLLAQLLAARGLARAAILLTPAPPWGVLPSSENEIAAAMGLMSLGPIWDQTISAVFEIAAANSLNCLSPARQEEVFAQFVPESGRALYECLFWMFDLGRASYVNAVNVDCPLLAIAGGRDRVISPATVQKVADKYRDQATYLEFPDMGHMLLLEDGWRDVAQACGEWLAANGMD
ncbi:MAG: alpha/beta hydrolase [Rhodospirillaceae bacterium]|mgnify:CR=1 FL=1|jgi:non-heme chloroperoxidase|nr:alpha/beta hydrolase [Rhodospirillaceae bacterium]MBT4488343.1 alpha/beta hydrolase [Rhodospirillaceae bacterium]MBT5194928.1 alpha/beta hydrolase [Rhodospirillaceae bacterium]MBT5896605.1 alpha/beta hydrolase [Rhodospirillaceae bacterium]MBT6428156.1 alpha/beta hydrolase [Rhodospirillaceae bacterium]